MWNRIIGAVLILGDIYYVYYIGVSDAMHDFGTAIFIVIIAILGVILLAKR